MRDGAALSAPAARAWPRSRAAPWPCPPTQRRACRGRGRSPGRNKGVARAVSDPAPFLLAHPLAAAPSPIAPAPAPAPAALTLGTSTPALGSYVATSTSATPAAAPHSLAKSLYLRGGRGLLRGLGPGAALAAAPCAAACAATHVMKLVVPQLKIWPTALLLPRAAAIIAALSAACVRLTSCEPSPGTSTGRPPATHARAASRQPQRRAARPHGAASWRGRSRRRGSGRGSGRGCGAQVGSGCGLRAAGCGARVGVRVRGAGAAHGMHGRRTAQGSSCPAWVRRCIAAGSR